MEKEKYLELQNTWKKANETFVEQNITMSKQVEDMRLQLVSSQKQSEINSKKITKLYSATECNLVK